MSIIYEALKKVGGLSAEGPLKKTDKPSRPKPRPFIILAFIAALAVLAVNLFLRAMPRHSLPKPAPDSQHLPQTTPQPPAQPQAAETPAVVPPAEPVPAPEPEVQKPQPPDLVLNGVFVSEQESYALINNRIVRKGEQIEGATVVRIGMDEVELDFEGSPIKLFSESQ